MKAKELAKELLKNPDFEVRFVFLDGDEVPNFAAQRVFKDVKITDVGFIDSGFIILSGEEE